MTTLLAYIIVLGVLVFVHELGHFLVAKWVGVKVHVFSIGFGPKLACIKRGDTDYRIAAIPLGGYVKMAGHDPNEPLHGTPDEFLSRKIWERMAIIFAGPLMNILLAVILVAAVFYIGVNRPAFLNDTPVIGWVDQGSVAEKAGLERNDVIVGIDGVPIESWQDVFSDGLASRKDRIEINVLRDKLQQSFVLNLKDTSVFAQSLSLGFQPKIEARVGSVMQGWPADSAGLKPGDLIVSANGDSVLSFHHVSQILKSIQGQPLDVTVLRNGEYLDFTIVPRFHKEESRYLIGFRPDQNTIKKRFGAVESIERSVETNIAVVGLIGDFFNRLFIGEANRDEVGGPIFIAQVAGEAARSGFTDLIYLMGFLSLQLGLLNLLPIPILDGGQLFLLTLEAVMRKPLSAGAREIAQMFGLVVLLSVMIWIFYNDISRLLTQ